MHLCDTERPELPPWNFVKKAERATWQRSSGGLKWLQYSGISHDSWILREASGYTAPCVIFHISSSKVRRGTLREAKQPDSGTLAWRKYEVKLFQFMYFSLSMAPWNTKGHKIELFEMWSSALIFFFFFSSESSGRLYPLYDSDKCHRPALTLDSVPLSIVGGFHKSAVSFFSVLSELRFTAASMLAWQISCIVRI